MLYLGEIAAIGTAICWTLSAVLFERASKKIGPLSVNIFKLIIGFILLTIFAAIFLGRALPIDANQETYFFLIISGIFGFSIADVFLFRAYVTIGARVTMLFMALTPAITAFFSFIVFQEAMKPFALLGMLFVIGGIALVVFKPKEKPVEKKEVMHQPIKTVLGYGIAMLAAVNQSIGLLFSKRGLSTGYDALGATQIRILAGLVGFFVIMFITRQCKVVFKSMQNARAMQFTAMGAFFGPAAGVTLSLVALQLTSAGNASTLIALSPVLILPLEWILFRKKVTVREFLGAILAVGGSVLFFV